jgi:signal transduction histidine kinase
MRWLDRILARASLEPNRVFPTEELVDHVPLLLDGIAAYVEDPATAVQADMAAVDKARELGALRHAQGFDAFEILKEFDLLGNILLTFLARVADTSPEPCSRGELVACAQRVFQAIHVLEEATTTHFLQLLSAKVAEREERLRAFDRTLTHEFRNRIGAALGAAEILVLPELADATRDELVAVIARNVKSMKTVLEGLEELTRIESDQRQHRHVYLPQAAREAARQLRDMARANRVEVRISPDIPAVEVNAAAVELCLTNLVANAIKYADQSGPARWVEVRAQAVARTTARTCSADAGEVAPEVLIEVADNGMGVPETERERLFERYFRAGNAEASGAPGTGLGLSIVQETVAALGGRAWAEFPEAGSIFAFSLPCRRSWDRPATSARPQSDAPPTALLLHHSGDSRA